MRLLLASILILTLISQGLALHKDPPLKAMLYCYLPAVNTVNNWPEYSNLALIVNEMLREKGINVEVEVCDQNTTGSDLYNQDTIDSLFNQYDILEIDVTYIWAITTNLVTFKRS
jgi:ABC-type transport system substrate-binding protein